jgi:CRP/FNR family transcriptional regulator, anaerobic regulatory protein
MPQAAPAAMNPGLSEEDFVLTRLIAPLRARAVAEGCWREIAAAARTTLIEQGDGCDSIFVLVAGLVKLSYRTPDGDEWIKSFIVDDGLFGADPSADDVSAIRYAATAIEAVQYVRLSRAWVAAALASDPRLMRLFADFSAWVLRRKQVREEMLLCLSAEDRYRQLLATEPDLAARLMQADIARYIGITPIALSRIKRRVATA